MSNLHELTEFINKYLGSSEEVKVDHDGNGYFAIIINTNLGKKHIGEWMCARETKAYLQGMRLMMLMLERPKTEGEHDAELA